MSLGGALAVAAASGVAGWLLENALYGARYSKAFGGARVQGG